MSEHRTFAVVTGVELPDLNQRVVRVLAAKNGLARVKYGDHTLQVPPERLRPVTNVSYEVGDRVSCDRGPGAIREVIWHFKDGEPNYYLEIDGRKASKRYRDEDLAPGTN